jgi:hypothetical protein
MMLTRKYANGLFACDYMGQTTISTTRRGARMDMELAIFYGFVSTVLH